jgi:hypothetical protein
MKTKRLKIEFLTSARTKVWLFLNCGEGRYIAVPDNRDQRYTAVPDRTIAGTTAPIVPAFNSPTRARAGAVRARH